MKTLFLSLILFVSILTCTTLGQQKEAFYNSSDVPVFVKDGANPMPMKQQGSALYYTVNDTCDSVQVYTPGFISNVVTLNNNATSSDTLYFSTVSTFLKTKTIKRIGGTNFKKNISASTFYIKYGYLGTTTGKAYQLEIE